MRGCIFACAQNSKSDAPILQRQWTKFESCRNLRNGSLILEHNAEIRLPGRPVDQRIGLRSFRDRESMGDDRIEFDLAIPQQFKEANHVALLGEADITVRIILSVLFVSLVITPRPIRSR